MKTPDAVIKRNAIRLIEAELSLEIWHGIKSGRIIYGNPKYDVDERIEHYTKRREEYLKKVAGNVGVNYGLLSLIFNTINAIFPDIVKTITKLLNIK